MSVIHSLLWPILQLAGKNLMGHIAAIVFAVIVSLQHQVQQELWKLTLALLGSLTFHLMEKRRAVVGRGIARGGIPLHSKMVQLID